MVTSSLTIEFSVEALSTDKINQHLNVLYRSCYELENGKNGTVPNQRVFGSLVHARVSPYDRYNMIKLICDSHF